MPRSVRKRRVLPVVVAAAVAAVGLAPVQTGAAAEQPTTAVQPVVDCASLVKEYPIPAAKTRVESAKVVPAGNGEPEHCDLRGTIEPAVKFQLRLPTTTYQGRYLQYGCGGFCGAISPTPFAKCAGPAGGDVAVAATDDGHRSDAQLPEGRWAQNNRAARDDWQFRAPHVLSVAAKRVISTFYGEQPKRSYFTSCSNGGREALLLAQRYPHDFDGIVAGAPANYAQALIGVYFGWMSRANTDQAGKPILTPAELPVLHRAALAKCDRIDGLTDGQIDDPRRCDFDPVVTRCRDGSTTGCLTPQQVAAARKMYAGPTDPQGRRLYPGAQTPGSELSWAPWHVPIPGFGSLSHAFSDEYLKYVGYPIGTPHSSLAEFGFTAKEFHRLTAEGVRANAMSLDLSAFRKAGGKLVVWHGWDDPAIPATGTLDYYQRLTERSGGPTAIRGWARTFVVPTLYHCGAGYALTEFDPLAATVAWVEQGTAPDKVIATGRDADGNVTRTRPVYPYPLRARYDGSGSIDDAANFVPAPPVEAPRDKVRWLGEYLHGLPGPSASPR